jgi:putative acetyltransferase
MSLTLRKITSGDDQMIAFIIRKTLTEFGANKPGTVFFDESTDRLSTLFVVPKSIYYIALWNEVVVGGAGIYPTDGLPEGTCELVKMYLLPEYRGKGIGKALIEQCITFAKVNGFSQVYLETMPELKRAVTIYNTLGFIQLPCSLGNTGHFGCDIWMVKSI